MEEVSTGTRRWPEQVAVVGVGTMGLGVAEYFIANNINVRMVDATPEQSRAAPSRLVERIRGHVEAGLLEPRVLERAAVQPIEDIASAVAGVDLVFEAVFERIDVKADVLRTICAAVGDDVIIASNTSSLPIDELAAFVTHPERFLGMHWFNPPEWTPGIEIIPGQATAPNTLTQVKTFLEGIGKHPVVVASSPGFIGNRLQFALFLEALACVEEGLASPEEVDEVVRSCFGFRLPFYGPFQIADMAGLDVYANVFDTLERGLGEKFRMPAALQKIVDQGHTGTKSGEGFYRYTDEERDRLLITRDQRYARLNKLLRGDEGSPSEG